MKQSTVARTLFLSVITICVLIGFSNDVLGQLEIVNVRVGQGDATIIQGPIINGDRINVLIDGGNISNRDGGNILRTVLRKRGIDHLDYIIITHYDADHIGGVVSGGHHGVSFLLGFNGVPGDTGDDDQDGIADWIDQPNFTPDAEEFGTDDDISVGHFIDRGDQSPPSSIAYQKYIAMAESQGSRISLTNHDHIDTFKIDLGDGCTMMALAGNGFVRDRAARVSRVNTENERSLSFLVKYDDFDYLISGDLIGRKHGSENAKMEQAVGEYIFDQGLIIDVLHVNHHGANNGSDELFLELIKPTIAVISAGNGNSHKHPANRALKRLEKADVYRIIQTSWGSTDLKMPTEVRKIQAIYQNDVVISSDGQTFEISTSRRFDVDDNPLR